MEVDESLKVSSIIIVSLSAFSVIDQTLNRKPQSCGVPSETSEQNLVEALPARAYFFRRASSSAKLNDVQL